VLKWVREGEFNERHIHIQSQRKEGTGQWLFETLQFQQWMERKSSPVLLGCGIRLSPVPETLRKKKRLLLFTAGAGKTFLSSVVIDHLLDRQSHDAVAYIYFGYQDQLRQKPIDIISSFTKQLLGQLPELPPDIESSYDNMTKKSERPNYEALKGFLFSLPRRFASNGKRTYIVCDALDEMHEYDQRQELLPLFHDMKDGGFEIFLTSRPHPADVRVSFANAIQLELTPHHNDLQGYIQEKINRSTGAKYLIESSKTLKFENVISALIASAEGMYGPNLMFSGLTLLTSSPIGFCLHILMLYTYVSNRPRILSLRSFERSIKHPRAARSN